jgi:hypothetical protein
MSALPAGRYSVEIIVQRRAATPVSTKRVFRIER